MFVNAVDREFVMALDKREHGELGGKLIGVIDVGVAINSEVQLTTTLDAFEESNQRQAKSPALRTDRKDISLPPVLENLVLVEYSHYNLDPRVAEYCGPEGILC